MSQEMFDGVEEPSEQTQPARSPVAPPTDAAPPPLAAQLAMRAPSLQAVGRYGATLLVGYAAGTLF